MIRKITVTRRRITYEEDADDCRAISAGIIQSARHDTHISVRVANICSTGLIGIVGGD
jgi:hypothetical protein